MIKEKKVIFVTGMPRSMTTLMCNILANNPKIGGGETSPLLEYVFGARGNYTHTPEVKAMLDKKTVKEAFIDFCYWGIQGYANKITDKEILVDKSRGHVHYKPMWDDIFPEHNKPKFILLIRDIRSIVASLEKKWRDNPLIQDKRDDQASMSFITLTQRVNHFLSEAPLRNALMRIGNAIDTGTIRDFIVVKAEELTRHPEDEMRRVYHALGEEYCDVDYLNIKQMTIENDRISDYGIYGDHSIRPTMEPTKYNDKFFPPSINDMIFTENKWFYDFFQYKK